MQAKVDSVESAVEVTGGFPLHGRSHLARDTVCPRAFSLWVLQKRRPRTLRPGMSVFLSASALGDTLFGKHVYTVYWSGVSPRAGTITPGNAHKTVGCSGPRSLTASRPVELLDLDLRCLIENTHFWSKYTDGIRFFICWGRGFRSTHSTPCCFKAEL